MKSIALGVLAFAGLAAPALAVDFTGPHAPANWTVANTGSLIGGSPTLGSATFSSTQLVLTGANSLAPPPGGDTPGCAGGVFQTLGPCQVQATIGLGGQYRFDWAYRTSDGSGPGGDIFGVIVDGARVALSDPGGANAQNATSSFSAGSSFGWFINCTDCIGGAATTTVSGLVYAQVIPEPSTYALMLLGALGVIGRQRQHRRNRPTAA